MFPDGTYVRLLLAPNTRIGTVSEGTVEAGKEKYVFRHDPRVNDPLPAMYVFGFDIEACSCPSDAEVQTINALIKRGGG
jgi:hypothetical protein